MIQDFKKLVGNEILICLVLNSNLLPLNASELSRILSISYPTICESIVRLSEAGLVVRNRKGVSYFYELTSKGIEFSGFLQSSKNKYEELI